MLLKAKEEGRPGTRAGEMAARTGTEGDHRLLDQTPGVSKGREGGGSCLRNVRYKMMRVVLTLILCQLNAVAAMYLHGCRRWSFIL